MADTRTMKGLDGLLDQMKKLPAEIVSKRGGVVAPALRKGGVVIQKQAQANIRAVTRNTVAEGYTSTQTLEKAVVVRRDPNPQRSGAAERYRVVIARGRKYPGGRVNKKGGKPLTAVMTGRYLEYGTEDQPAEPWMTPAYMNKREAALITVVDEMGKGVQKAIRKAEQGAKK
jgi:HK97 gp10 family phage protein